MLFYQIPVFLHHNLDQTYFKKKRFIVVLIKGEMEAKFIYLCWISRWMVVKKHSDTLHFENVELGYLYLNKLTMHIFVISNIQ